MYRYIYIYNIYIIYICVSSERCEVAWFQKFQHQLRFRPSPPQLPAFFWDSALTEHHINNQCFPRGPACRDFLPDPLPVLPSRASGFLPGLRVFSGAFPSFPL